MISRVDSRLWITSSLLFPLFFLSCSKRGPSIEAERATNVVAAPVEKTHVVPRRINPIIITNVTVPAQTAVVHTNTIPVIQCGPEQSFSCSSADGLQVTLAVHVEDADGDALAVVWSADGRERFTQQVPAGESQTTANLTYVYTFTPGDHGVKVSVSDGSATAVCDSSVTVEKDTQAPVIACPRDLTVFPDPGQCFAVVTFNPKATDNCPDVAVVCEPPSGTPFPIGTSTVTCTATDTAGNSSDCAFTVTVQIANRCPKTEAFWRQNLGAWPVNSLRLGGSVYSKSQLMSLLRAPGTTDLSLVMARQLIAASLNTAASSDPRPICAQLAEANNLFAGFSGKLPYHVTASSPAGRSMVTLANILNGYNSGMFTSNCAP